MRERTEISFRNGGTAVYGGDVVNAMRDTSSW